MPGDHPEAVERPLPAVTGRGSAGGLPGLPALPAVPWCTRDDQTWSESDADLALVCEQELRACNMLP